MGFADNYFTRYLTCPRFFEKEPDAALGLIVVIPCYDDEHILITLNSLEKAIPPSSKTEVIVVVNSAINTPQQVKEKNKMIYSRLEHLRSKDSYENFSLLPLYIDNIPVKHAGVGYARKTGMDEAVRRFNSIDKPEGIIVSLDADTLVSKSYFTYIEKAFCDFDNRAFTFQYRHDFNINKYTEEEIQACKTYELYLRYYKISLELTGFPYVFYTIGSAFAVDAYSYIKVGGMPRKQGGEDFYFLNKIAGLTPIKQLSSVLVYPSPRTSDRVPFGTGPSVNKIIKEKTFKVYNFQLFILLRQFFDWLKCFSVDEKLDLTQIPLPVKSFIGETQLKEIFNECRLNARVGKNLEKRLFSKFDAFWIVKFLNSFQESREYPPIDITEATTLLMDYLGKKNEAMDIEQHYYNMIILENSLSG